MSQNIFNSVLVKKDGKLTYDKKTMEKLFNAFVSSIQEGQKVDVIFETQTDTGSTPQIARLHATIREIATDTGHTFEEIKMLVKEKSGLCIQKKEQGQLVTLCKSFGDCSREQLNLAIQASIEIGEALGINLY